MYNSRYQRVASEDEERLPEGMSRTGYDADTQSYIFRDETDGSTWESEPGSRFGTLHPAGMRAREMSEREEAIFESAKREDWRYMAPFILLIALFLLVVWRFFGPALSFSQSGGGYSCHPGDEGHQVVKGDTCWSISQEAAIEVEDLVRANDGLSCERLRLGSWVCVPPKGNGK